MVNNVITKLENLNLTDRFLFDEVMEDTQSCQTLISILLENEISLLTRPQTEKELRLSPELRQVRLDVVSMDRDRNLYFTEMQKRNTGNLMRRSRYYQAQLDISLLKPGTTDFNLLNDSCFILIAPFDLFGKGLYRYTFEGVCRECPQLKIKDGAVRVFINTRGTNREEFSGEFLDLMEYIMHSTDEVAQSSESHRIRLLHRNVRNIRMSEKTGVKYMQKWEELVYARKEGEERGETLLLIRQICKKLTKGQPPEIIADELEADPETVRQICQAVRKTGPDIDCNQLYEQIFGEPSVMEF